MCMGDVYILDRLVGFDLGKQIQNYIGGIKEAT